MAVSELESALDALPGVVDQRADDQRGRGTEWCTRELRTARRDRSERTDPRDSQDSRDQADSAEPAERIDPNEPRLAMLSAEFTLPIDSTDRREPMQSTESLDQRDHRDLRDDGMRASCPPCRAGEPSSDRGSRTVPW